jgi:hypothetical protein
MLEKEARDAIQSALPNQSFGAGPLIEELRNGALLCALLEVVIDDSKV